MEIVDKREDIDLSEVIKQGDVICDSWGDLYLLVLNDENYKYGFIDLKESQTVGKWCDTPAKAANDLFGNRDNSNPKIVNARVVVTR